MTKGRGAIEPRTFFLNEQHEPARGEKEGGGRVPNYAPIDWKAKAARLNRTLRSTATKLQRSPDPLRDARYYLISLPQRDVMKMTKQTAEHPSGQRGEETDYGRKHSLVFRKLGLDLIDVTSTGEAVVHATKERLERLLESTMTLADAGPKQKSRFMTIESFDVVPGRLRADDSWLATLPRVGLVDTVIELQPLLTRAEFESVLRVLTELFEAKGEGFTRSGADFSGRQWLRGRIARNTVEAIVGNFWSVQSVHPPLYCELWARAKGRQTLSKVSLDLRTPTEALPTVAVVDSGIPSEHAVLAPYRRGIGYVNPDSEDRRWVGNHGSLVASRVVFGDIDAAGKALYRGGQCQFYDVMVALDQDGHVDQKGVIDALNAVVGTGPGRARVQLQLWRQLAVERLGRSSETRMACSDARHRQLHFCSRRHYRDRRW